MVILILDSPTEKLGMDPFLTLGLRKFVCKGYAGYIFRDTLPD